MISQSQAVSGFADHIINMAKVESHAFFVLDQTLFLLIKKRFLKINLIR